MHICLLVKDFAEGKKFAKNGVPLKSGAEFHAENHALQLIRRGHQVTIMARKHYFFTKAREVIKGIDLVRLHEPFRSLEVFLRLLTTHRDVDVFYILGTPKFAVGAILYAKLMHKKVVLSLTGKAEIFAQNASWRMRLFSSCDHYLALSEEIKAGYQKQAHIDAKKITVLGQGIDTSRFAVPTDEQKRQLRSKFGILEDIPVVLFCARVVFDKGIRVVFEIWPEIHRRIPQAKLIVVGGGQTDILNDLRKLSNEQADSIMVVGEVDNPLPYDQMSDVYLFPSKHEGLPTTLMEAMSCGLVPVASDIGGCRDLVQDGTGYLVSPTDANGFLEKVVGLLEKQQLRKQFSQAAAEYVHTHCDYSYTIGKLEQILREKAKKDA